MGVAHGTGRRLCPGDVHPLRRGQVLRGVGKVARPGAHPAAVRVAARGPLRRAGRHAPLPAQDPEGVLPGDQRRRVHRPAPAGFPRGRRPDWRVAPGATRDAQPANGAPVVSKDPGAGSDAQSPGSAVAHIGMPGEGEQGRREHPGDGRNVHRPVRQPGRNHIDHPGRHQTGGTARNARTEYMGWCSSRRPQYLTTSRSAAHDIQARRALRSYAISAAEQSERKINIDETFAFNA